MPTFGMSRADGISDYLKVFIKQGDVTVVGYIGEGASKQLSSMWVSPFEGDTVGQAGGGAYDKTADLVQVQSSTTSKTVMNTALVWEGISPHEVTLPIYLKAFENAKAEVNDAIMHLEKMASPQLQDMAGMGSIPAVCEVNIGRRLILPRCQIKDVSSELDVPKDSKGYMTRNTVQLSISMDRMTNKDSVPSLYK